MIDGKPRIGDEVYIHGYIDEIRNDVVIIRNEGGYFGTSDREIFYYEEDERGYGTMNEADRKDENCSENRTTARIVYGRFATTTKRLRTSQPVPFWNKLIRT